MMSRLSRLGSSLSSSSQEGLPRYRTVTLEKAIGVATIPTLKQRRLDLGELRSE